MCLCKLARKLRLFYEPTNFFGRAASPNKKATYSVAFLLGLRRAIRGSLLGVQRSPSGRCPFGLLALEAHTCARCAGLVRAFGAPLLSLSQKRVFFYSNGKIALCKKVPLNVENITPRVVEVE
jgi:hypothetical protein